MGAQQIFEQNIDGLFVRRVSSSTASSSDPLFVLVPGGLHGAWAYERWQNMLADTGWDSAAVSLRNHRPSYRVTREEFLGLSLEDYIYDVERIITASARPVILLGHSMGGLVVQRVAERRDDVQGLVLVASVGPGQLGAIRPPLPEDAPLMFGLEEAREMWFYAIADADYARIYPRIEPESPSVINEYSGGQVEISRASILCPVLVVGPRHDRTPVHDPRRIAEFYGADLLEVADSGHSVMLEPCADRVCTEIARWAATNVKQPPARTIRR